MDIILNYPLPKNIRQLRAFLGLVTYCRSWIPNASELLGPLYALTTEGKFVLNEEHIKAIENLKKTLTEAPALALPNYEKPFQLFCHENNVHATGVLCQKYGGKTKPIAYYSCQLDPIIKGSPSCVRAVAACALLLDKVADLVLDHKLS